MRFSAATTALVALLSTAVEAAPTATGRAIVVNKCTAPAFLWAVGSSVGRKVMIPKNGRFMQPYAVDPTTGGMALKITTVDEGLYMANTPQTIFSYSLKSDQVWYDLSDVSGNAFEGKRILVAPSTPNCDSIDWPKGVPPTGSQVKACSPSADVTLTLCA